MPEPLSRDEFIARAARFIEERSGTPAAAIDPSVDLHAAGILDSLLIVEFFVFLEDLKGSQIDASQFSLAMLTTLDAAYSLVAPAGAAEVS